MKRITNYRIVHEGLDASNQVVVKLALPAVRGNNSVHVITPLTTPLISSLLTPSLLTSPGLFQELGRYKH